MGAVIQGVLRSIARRALPATVRRRIRRRRPVALGDLRRVVPISPHFGWDRGLPIDRYYIERFLAAHADDVRGRVLEIGDDTYTRRFGGGRVTTADVLHVSPNHTGATFAGDLSVAATLPPDTFDCVVLTQTLQLIYDVAAAVGTVHRSLVPGGVVLATVPGISQLDGGEWRRTWYWSFTPVSARRLFEEHFPSGALHVESHGNVLSAIAFLEGLAVHELRAEELDAHDPCYPLTITVRAMKPRPPRP